MTRPITPDLAQKVIDELDALMSPGVKHPDRSPQELSQLAEAMMRAGLRPPIAYGLVVNEGPAVRLNS